MVEAREQKRTANTTKRQKKATTKRQKKDHVTQGGKGELLQEEQEDQDQEDQEEIKTLSMTTIEFQQWLEQAGEGETQSSWAEVEE